jgi:ubiquinone/menaquinone biosynthesis C-methylase UbiE
MDITDMREFETGSFDIAIDKGTMDALVCAQNSYIIMAQMLKETQRVLKVGGIFFAVSFQRPECLKHFDRPFLSFENRDFILYDSTEVSEEEKEPNSHYIYISKKLPDADEMSSKNFDEFFFELTGG